MSLPLSGVRVVDLARLVPGDYCTSLLAGLGADVVKVEDLAKGDYIGEFGGEVAGVQVAHHLFNRGKRSVAVDLKRPEGLAVLRRLVAGADILVESFRPGVMSRLGLDHERARADHPALVWVAISGHGSQDPRSLSPGHDLNYLAETGLLHRLVGTDGTPVPPPIPLADLVGGGLLPAFTAVAMVMRARLTGVGGYVDASIADGFALLPSVLLADVVAGVPVEADGRRTLLGGGLACYGVYRLRDGYAVVGALEAKFWEPLCLRLGHPELIPLHRDRQVQDKVRTVLQESLGRLTAQEVEELGLTEEACVSLVRSYEEGLSRAGALAASRVTPTTAGFLAPGLPFRIDGEPVQPAPSAPVRGQDTVAVLADAGMSEEVIAQLLASGVLSQGAGPGTGTGPA